MKIKVSFEFEGEIPKELWWLGFADWGDQGVSVALKHDPALVLSFQKRNDIPVTMQLKTECTGINVTGCTPNLDA